MKNSELVCDNKNFKKETKKGIKYFKKLPKTIFSPALNDDIKIGRSFWNHTAGKKGRTLKQVFYRVKHIKDIPQILGNLNMFQSHTKEIRMLKNGNSTLIEYWSLQAVFKKSIIELVIRKVSNQEKHLYSLVYKGASPRIK